MNEKILKQAAVRIKIYLSGEIASLGSGVIVRNKDGNYFVITAKHCIFGKNGDKLKNIEISNIIIEHKHNNEDTFSQIEVVRIEYSCDKQDIAVLSIESLDWQENIYYGKIAQLVLGNNNYAFRGYPNYLSHQEEHENYINCEYQSSDNSKFIIKSDKIKDSSAEIEIDETAYGLSGSGVFIYENSQPYLIGIITDLKDESGLFGQLVCKKLDDIALRFNLECIDINQESKNSIKTQMTDGNIAKSTDQFITKPKTTVINVNPNIILFNAYTDINEQYYKEREQDISFIHNLKISNLWLFGKSGKGKTALINRNLIQNKIEYLFCDLSPITINEVDNIFEEIICCIETKFDVIRCVKEKNGIKQICKLINSCNLKKEIIIVIDELAVDNVELLKAIAAGFISLVTHYSNSANDSSLKFIVSTILEPKNLIKNKSKADNYFEYICCDNWDSPLSSLFDILNTSLCLEIAEDDKGFILSKSENSPRLLKTIFRKIIASQEKSSISIRKYAQLAYEEHF